MLIVSGSLEACPTDSEKPVTTSTSEYMEVKTEVAITNLTVLYTARSQSDVRVTLGRLEVKYPSKRPLSYQ